MTSHPFLTADPADLCTMVQEGVECEQCKGTRFVITRVDYNEEHRDCPTCKGTGKTPLSDSDLNAMAACVCYGKWVRLREAKWFNKDGTFFVWEQCYSFSDGPFEWHLIDNYTTSPDAAMRLQVKYALETYPWKTKNGIVKEWRARPSVNVTEDSKATNKDLCRAITEAALIAALTEAIEGSGDAGD